MTVLELAISKLKKENLELKAELLAFNADMFIQKLYVLDLEERLETLKMKHSQSLRVRLKNSRNNG